jgi:hypothetical protein
MTEEQWYWNLKQGRAVPASERGPADDLMGPYDSKEEAERWRERFDARNEEWKQADREWEGEEEEG